MIDYLTCSLRCIMSNQQVNMIKVTNLTTNGNWGFVVNNGIMSCYRTNILSFSGRSVIDYKTFFIIVCWCDLNSLFYHNSCFLKRISPSEQDGFLSTDIWKGVYNYDKEYFWLLNINFGINITYQPGELIQQSQWDFSINIEKDQKLEVVT